MTRFCGFGGEHLVNEHRNLCFSYHLNLPAVAVTVQDMGRDLGRWDSLRQMISISTDLIATEPWSVVMEILKHEMAHQWVSEYHVQDDGHGPLFQEACKRLRVAPWARRAGIQLGDRMGSDWQGALSEQESALIRRTQKLLALAQSCNQFEAEAAMRKVKELYDRYHLEHLNVFKDSDYETIVINTRKKRVEAYQDMIVSILMKFYNVVCIYSHMYDAKLNEKHRVFEVSGLRHNVAMADYVYAFVENHVNIFWRDYKKNRKDVTLRSRNQFLCGAVKGFRDKLELHERELKASMKNVSAEKRSLILSDQRQLETYKRYLYPRLSTIRFGGVNAHSEAFHAGTEKGRSLNLHHGVKQKSSEKTHYIDRV